MIHRVRERAAFQRLAADGVRIRRSALWCTWCPVPDSTATFVAFALGRALGPAVTRNRLRRRLRAVLAEIDREEPLPQVMMLFGARPRATELTFDQLDREMHALIGEIRRACRA